MKTFYKYSSLYLFILSFFLTSCGLFDGKKNNKLYTIPVGEHSSKSSLHIYSGEELRFLAKFDNTATYNTKNSVNQADINKLYGFSDCGSQHHVNSARFGWRWYNNKLDIFAYTYSNSTNSSEYITSVELNQEYEYKIQISGSDYIFTLNGISVTLDRGCSGKGGSKYYLFPYFGGDETAPHDIHINIKEL